MKVTTQLMKPHKLFGFVLALLLLISWLRGIMLLTTVSINGGYSLLNWSITTSNEWAHETAFDWFQQAASWQKKDTAWRALGHMYAAQGEEEMAIAMWHHVTDQTTMRQELYRWGQVSERQRDSQAAIDWYQRAILLHPETADAWYFAAQQLEKEDNLQAAVDYYQQGFDTGQFELVGPSDITLRLGVLAYAEQNWPLVDYWLDLALAQADFRLSDRAWEAHYIRAESLRLRGNLAAAASDFQWVVDHNPTHYWAHIRLAQVHWQIEDDTVSAESLLQQAIAIAPNRKWAYRIQGDLYRYTQNVEAAVTMYHHVLRLDPQDELARQYLEELEHNGN